MVNLIWALFITHLLTIDANEPLALPSFYDRPEFKTRAGGIDVSKHSKEGRRFSEKFVTTVTSEPAAAVTTVKSVTTDASLRPEEKPKLKVGIVLPKQIFKQRLYQQHISRYSVFADIRGGRSGTNCI